MNQLRVDLKFPPQGISWSQLQTVVEKVDAESEFDAVWLFDHLASVSTGPNGSPELQPIFEGWTALSALAGITKRVRLGLMVASIGYRPLGVLVKMISTLDVISGGRLDLGLGAGNNPTEAEAYGINFPSAGERIGRLGEACEILDSVLTCKESFTFEGEYFSFKGANNLPNIVQSRMPVFIGGKGEKKTFPIIARYADYWNYSNGTPEEFALKYSVLIETSKRLDLDRRVPTPSVQIQVTDDKSDEPIRLATQYIERGARHILLYSTPNLALLSRLNEISSRLKQLDLR
jgi:alkanesulfonate monooxygenase SsuD/methylene tetrahydromethanopterin reductase-like flavin-dependent oxidoreductase (luciferase family)